MTVVAPLPENEAERLQALRDYGLLDTPSEDTFDRITRLAASICDAPIALISLVDTERQWFKSKYGLEADETHRDYAFCAHAIGYAEPLIVENALEDPRFSKNPLVLGPPHIRTYVGAPLVTPEGFRLGTLCVIFDKVTELSKDKIQRLQDLAALTIDEFELRRAVRHNGEANRIREKALVQARRQEELLESITSVARVGGWELDLSADGPIWASVTRQIHEMPEDYEPTLDEAVEFYLPEYRPIVTETIEDCIKTGNPFDFEAQIKTGKGRVVWVRSVGRAIYQNGEAVKLIGAFQDITEKREEQETLANALSERERALGILTAYQSALDEHAIVAITDARGRITFANDKFCDLSGYTEEELLGQNHRILNSGHHEKSFFEGLWQTISKGQAWHGDVCNRSKSGENYWVSTTIVPIMGTDGRPEEYISIRYDITSRINSQKALKARTEQLESTSRRLEQELSRQAETAAMLEESRKQAESANVAKSEFLATMSHELRTPMNGVMGMLELALRDVLPDKQRTRIKTARNSAKILLQLLNDILDISKLEEGQVTLESVAYDPKMVADDVLNFLKVNAADKSLSLNISSSLDIPPTIMGDPTRFRQVLINLVGNAIKFSENSAIDIRMNYDPASMLLETQVQDYGIGITTEQMSKLFRRFSQGDSSMTRQFGGTGLGLAISKQLVELMGGSIEAKSTPGEGSVFTFTVSALPTSSSMPQSASNLPTEDILSQDQKYRILVAEDNEINQMVIEAFVQTLGHSCQIVEDGRRAVDALDMSDYDLVLMDVQMPEMDGVEATRRIRERQDNKANVPIIALTANAMSGDREKYISGGMTDYLSKPLSAGELSAAIVRVMASSDGMATRTNTEDTTLGCDALNPDQATGT